MSGPVGALSIDLPDSVVLPIHKPYRPIEARRFEAGQEREAIAALEAGSVVRICRAGADGNVHETWLTPESWRRLCEAKWPGDDGR